MLGALSGFLVVSLPIAVGYVTAWRKLLSANAHEQLTRLVFFVMMPVMLFTLLAKARLAAVFSHLALVSFLAALVVFALYGLVAGVGWRRGLGPVTVGALGAGYTNANNIGLPIALHMLGDATLVAPVVLFQTVLMAPVGLALLDVASGRRRALWRVAVGAMANPIAVGSAMGLVACVLPWKLPPVVMDALSTIGGAAVPLMLMTLGMSLRGRVVLEAGPTRREALLAVGLKLVVMPAAAWALARFAFGLDAHSVYAAVALAALPTAGNVFSYAVQYRQSTVLARDTISLTILLAPLALLAVAWLLS
jgi:predicted permease